VILLRNLQTSLNHVDIKLRCLDTVGRLLLERVQHMRNLFKPHPVNRTVGVAVVGPHQLEHAGAVTLPGFGAWLLAPNSATPDCLDRSPAGYRGRQSIASLRVLCASAVSRLASFRCARHKPDQRPTKQK
jgi:hypothetical protein